MRVECRGKCERRTAFQDSNFDAGGAQFEVRDGFPGVEIGGSRDAFPTWQLRARRLQSQNATRSKWAPSGREGVESERDTFLDRIPE